eukprot:944205-Amphidinium_carterae.1
MKLQRVNRAKNYERSNRTVAEGGNVMVAALGHNFLASFDLQLTILYLQEDRSAEELGIPSIPPIGKWTKSSSEGVLILCFFTVRYQSFCAWS